MAAILPLGLALAIAYVALDSEGMWILAYVRSSAMALGYYVRIEYLISLLSALQGVVSMIVTYFGLCFLLKPTFSGRSGLILGLSAALVGLAMESVVFLIENYADPVFRLLNPIYPLSVLSLIAWYFVLQILRWPVLIGAMLGGFLSTKHRVVLRGLF